MGIRIDPALELVWLDPTTVRLGVDPPVADVPVPTTPEERFVLALGRETPRTALEVVAAHCGLDAVGAAGVLGAASPAMIETGAADIGTVTVVGDGALAEAIAGVLAAEGAPVVRADPTDAHVFAGSRAVVAVQDHVVDPVLRAALATGDVPHLVVLVGDGRVRVGPVIGAAEGTVTGGPCLACLELHRADEDPHWPVVAAQLLRRPAPALGAITTAQVTALACGTVLDRLRRGAGAAGPPEQVLVARDGSGISRRSVPPHPACGCRAPRGTGSAPDRPRARIRVATT